MNLVGMKTFTLVFLITGAIDSIRNLPAAALFGDSLLFFFILAVLLFLIPIALVSATLSACWPENGGIYAWVRLAFGDKIAFLSIWLQWLNTLIWLPTILSFLAGTSAYLIHPSLALNKYYLFSVIVILNVLLTWVNLKGIHTSAKISTFCAIIGTMLPISFILGLGLWWTLAGKPLQIQLSWQTLLPNFGQMNSWISLTAIITSFLGIELACVHIRDVYRPQQTFPKALAISILLIIITIFFGSFTIAAVLPNEKIGLVNGIGDTFSYFLAAFQLQSFLPYIILMMLVGSFGGIISWIISPTRGLLQSVDYGYLPAFFAKINRYGAPANLLITQSCLVTIISLIFLFIPSINSLYWILTDLSTQLYIMMYSLMLIAALALSPRVDAIEGAFKIPGGKLGYCIVCLTGLAGCLCALVVGFFPPNHIDLGTAIPYQVIFGSCLALLMLPVFILYRYQQSRRFSPLKAFD